MRAYQLNENLDLTGIDMTDVRSFVESMSRIPREQVVALNDVLLAKRREFEAQFANMTTLYHGAPERSRVGNKYRDIYAEIKTNGFKLTQGRRSVGGLGATYSVDNLGIFLTDTPNLAQYFGDNRDDYGRGRVITCKVDTSNVYDSSTPNRELQKLGLELLNSYNGTKKNKLALKDWWWLVDQKSFVEHIKSLGHTGVRFKEETSVRKNANAFDGHTYFIFDPHSIHLKTSYTVEMFYQDIVDNRL